MRLGLVTPHLPCLRPRNMHTSLRTQKQRLAGTLGRVTSKPAPMYALNMSSHACSPQALKHSLSLMYRTLMQWHGIQATSMATLPPAGLLVPHTPGSTSSRAGASGLQRIHTRVTLLILQPTPTMTSATFAIVAHKLHQMAVAGPSQWTVSYLFDSTQILF